MTKNVVIGQNIAAGRWQRAIRRRLSGLVLRTISFVRVVHRRLVSFVFTPSLPRNNLRFLCHNLARFHTTLSRHPLPLSLPTHCCLALPFSIPHSSLSIRLVPGTHPSLLSELGQPRYVEPRLDRCHGIALGQHHVALP